MSHIDLVNLLPAGAATPTEQISRAHARELKATGKYYFADHGKELREIVQRRLSPKTATLGSVRESRLPNHISQIPIGRKPISTIPTQIKTQLQQIELERVLQMSKMRLHQLAIETKQPPRCYDEAPQCQ